MKQFSDNNSAQLNTTESVQLKCIQLWQSCWRWCCQIALVQSSLLSYLEPLIRLLQPGFRAHLSQARLTDLQQTGDFLQLTLKPGLRWQGFVPGQHVPLVVEMNGRSLRRTFSISSSLQLYQQHGLIQLTIQQQPEGQVTSQLRSYFEGTNPKHGLAVAPTVHLGAASGVFTLQPQLQPILLLAAGSGITPIHAMLSSMTRLTQPMLLIYSYRGEEALLFSESWQALQQRFPLLQVRLINTRCRHRLQVDELADWLADKPNSMIYLCGPSSFSQQWIKQFTQLAIPSTQIRQESFGLGRTQGQNDEQQSHSITVLHAAQQYSFQSGSGSLLQNLEAAGLQPTYGCRRGICMQCLCQKQQGLVRNLLTGEISDTGSGQIQLCISQPMSPVELKLGG